jgi:signal transduction histidine kinase
MENENELRILMVEDDMDDVHLIERVLRKGNLPFVNECVGKLGEFNEALSRFRPDIVLSDHGMPGFNSFEALQICLKEHSDIPFILVTGTVSDEYAIACLKNGVDDYVLKTNLLRLPTAIRSAVKKRNLERLKREAEVTLRKQNEELDNFVYSVSHNLRGPLLSVVGLLNLAENSSSKTELNDLHTMMRTSISRLNDTLNDIIEYSRNSRNEITCDYLDWMEIIRRTFLKMAYLHPAEDITKMLTLNTIVPFFSDIKRIEVVLGNLLINAVSYRSHDRELIIGVEVSTSDDDVVIVIKDNGIGIKEEVLPKIYNMFYRGTEASQGAGLGLYIVKEIVEKLNGKIIITSMAGICTTVTVTIPSEQMLKRRERERTIPVLKIHQSEDMASPGQWIMS